MGFYRGFENIGGLTGCAHFCNDLCNLQYRSDHGDPLSFHQLSKLSIFAYVVPNAFSLYKQWFSGMPCMLEVASCRGLVLTASAICYKEIYVRLQVNLSSKVQHNASNLQRHQTNLLCSSQKLLILLKIS